MYYFVPNRNFYVLLLTIILLAVFASPALAQDGLTVTVPDDDAIILHGNVIIGILFITSVFLAMFGGTIFALYKSAPPWLQPLLEAALQAGIRQIDTLVDNSVNKVDDVLWRDHVRKQFEDRGLIPPRFDESPTDPPAFG